VKRSVSVPSNRGPYAPGNERVAHATIDGHLVTIANMRDSIYSADAPTDVRWTNETFDARDLTNLWIYFSHFSKITGIAHSEIGFEFADGRCTIASFEIRPLLGQRFAAIAGMGRNFEMTLRWASERDIITKRLVKESSSRMYMFEADITHQRSVALFHAFLDRTNELHDSPEWYNTITNTCTTAIIDVVAEILPGQLQRTPRVLLPGTLPKYWAKRGVLKYEGKLDAAFDRASINERCREIGDVPDFSPRFHDRNQPG